MTLDEVQDLYLGVCRGYSEITIDSSARFLKHQSHTDRLALRKIYNEGLKIASDNGVKTAAESTEFYIEKGWWSKAKEDEVASISAFIEGLKKGREKMILASQRQRSSEMIAEEEEKLSSLLREKRSIIPITAEEYAEKYYNRHFLFQTIFEDANCTKKISDSEDYFSEMEEDLYFDTWSRVYKAIDFFKIENIKYVAATGFFQNLISVCGDQLSSFHFYGKPVVDLTLYQHDLFFYASRYKKILNSSTETIPDYILSDPKNLIDWCEGGGSFSNKAKSMMEKTPNKNKTKGDRTGRISSIVGATSSDYESLGMKSSKGDLIQDANSSGGSLDIGGVIKKTDSLGV
jgi:hypothetical protein